MVTFTVRHRAGLALKPLLAGLLTAWRGLRQGGATQRIWSERVTASVRATEITHGGDGWHPHLHVLLRTSEWSDDERDALLARWILHVERALGADCVPSRTRAIEWSEPIDVEPETDLTREQQTRLRYLFTLGQEIGGSKHGRGRNRSHWQILQDATNGNARARELWTEYSRATRGRRMIELDDRAARFAKLPDPNADLSPLVDSTLLRVDVPIDALELRGLREVERFHRPGIMADIARAVRVAQCAETAIREWLSDTLAILAYPSGNDRGPNQPNRARPAYHDTA